MKHIKFLAIAFVAMLTLASCSTDQEGPIYTPMSENVSLSTKTQSYQTQESSLEIPVRFVRSDASKEYTAHYNISTTADKVFSDPNNGEVTFKAGEGVAIVTIKAENMQKGTTYKAKLTLSDADVALKDTVTNNMLTESTISIMCDYEWEPLHRQPHLQLHRAGREARHHRGRCAGQLAGAQHRRTGCPQKVRRQHPRREAKRQNQRDHLAGNGAGRQSDAAGAGRVYGTEKVLPAVDFGEIHRPFFTVQKGLAQRVPVLFVSLEPRAGRVVRGCL